MMKSAGVVRLFLLLILAYSGIVLSNDGKNENIQSATIDVRLKFEGKDLMLTFPPNPNDAVQMASQFCYQQVPIDRIEERKECIRLVGQYLLEEVKKNNAMKQSRPQLEPSTTKSKDTISQIQMNIQGKIYDFEINTAVETTYDVAKRFCEANHQSFNILKTDVEKFCVIPIKTQMDSTMIKNSHASSVSSEERNSKEIKVTLQIGPEQFHLQYNPEVKSIQIVATEFCEQHKTQFGLTAENIVGYCIEPVKQNLEQQRDREL